MGCWPIAGHRTHSCSMDNSETANSLNKRIVGGKSDDRENMQTVLAYSRGSPGLQTHPDVHLWVYDVVILASSF